ncbi:MFS transporter [Hymenobacter terricola]|uniref:MFS transporter n=1 Tax=Hymenobacter terricola TaxID=2819236 RepID=UPI001B30FCFF|nr:MFS transporter [Hymenobacter terricola]
MALPPAAVPTATTDAATGRWILVAAVAASCMAFLDGSALNVALPALQHDLHADGAGLLWVLNGYLLVLAALILEGGTLGDRLGRKRVCMAGIFLFAVASLGSGLAPSTGWLIAARVVQGLGGALLIPGSLALISAGFPAARRGQAIGTWSAATTLVTLGGPALGGWLADAGWWRAIFLLNLPLAAVALLVLWRKVPETRDETATGNDWAGSALVALGLAALTFGLLSAPALGWASPRAWGPFGAGVLALGAFVAVEARSAHPMLPLGLFRSRTFSGTNLLTLLLYGALTAAMLFVSLNLVQVQGYSQLEAGLAFAPMGLLIALLSRRAGRWADQHGPRRLLTAGPLVVAAGFGWLSEIGLTAGPAAYWTTFSPGVALFGLGMALTVVPLTTAVMTAVDDQYAGTASGINNAVARTAGVLALAILGAFALTHFAGQLEQRTASLPLSTEARQLLHQEAGNLGAAAVPAAVSAAERGAVRTAIRESFRHTYQQMLWLCAGLAVASAGLAFWLVPMGPRRSKPQE